MISSTPWESARRLNFESVCIATAVLEAGRSRPPSEPAPRRIMSFSRSMTSNRKIRSNAAHDHMDRVGSDIDGRNTHALQDVYWEDNGLSAHATTVMRAPLAQLIREKTTAFVEHLERARDGHGGAMHRARVLSRRLREAILLAQSVTSIPARCR